LQINGNTIPTVKQLKYWGSIVQENGSSDLEIEKNISETRRVISMLNSTHSFAKSVRFNIIYRQP
jgi:hypothetical protein